ncbi:hypothetical protein P43SY_001700 [Pythium insidiosum]|uniref:Endoplasmic reticulum transmembrane protein n=1 Tax=Pythium insidiosum TaxID=114742 RepID=A0AAD5M2A9_PYTIN|nr:hypothetical protein P43SY_001700 [Pythium insidiosum]
MLINYLLFWMMITEGVVCLLISLPFGQGVMQGVVQFFSSRFGGRDSMASSVATVVLAIVALLFLSDINTCYKYHSSDTMLSDGLRIRLLTAQRDMYISGFCLFLFLLLRLVYHAMETNIRLEKSLGAMKKQAEGASTGYKALLEEQEKTKLQMAKLRELVGGGGDDADKGKSGDKDALTKLLDENAALSKQLSDAKKALATSDAKVEAVKKQAEGQSAAFMKLMDEKSAADSQAASHKALEDKLAAQEQQIRELTRDRDALKSQIQDYDFMFAEAKKKAE